MRSASRALLGLCLLAAFLAGVATGRLSDVPRESVPKDDYEIREGLQGYINPLLECEIANKQLYVTLRSFGDELEELIAALKRNLQGGTIAVYFRDLNNGPWVGYSEKKQFIPASLAKLPLVIACFKQAEIEPGFLSRMIRFEGLPEERDPDFMNPESNLERGQSYSVDQLIQRVAKYSDNASARLLEGAVSPSLLKRVYYDLGVDAARLKEMDFSLSPKEYGAFFRVLYNASYLSKQHSWQALEYLDQSTFELGLVAGVPLGTAVSHKFGVWENPAPGSSNPLQLHDCGVVYYPQRPYFLCVMTTGNNYADMTKAIAGISRFVHQQVSRDLRRPGEPVVVEPIPEFQMP